MIERCRIYLQRLIQIFFSPSGMEKRTSQRSRVNSSHDIQAQETISHTNMYAPGRITQYQGYGTGFDTTDSSFMDAFSEIGDLDLGPFMMNGNLDLLSYFNSDQAYSQAPPS